MRDQPMFMLLQPIIIWCFTSHLFSLFLFVCSFICLVRNKTQTTSIQTASFWLRFYITSASTLVMHIGQFVCSRKMFTRSVKLSSIAKYEIQVSQPSAQLLPVQINLYFFERFKNKNKTKNEQNHMKSMHTYYTCS